jgi:AGZA family xanthine/uracil permease-like MFS transporter
MWVLIEPGTTGYTRGIVTTLAHRFQVADRSTEALGGVATFLTMCYILFVNPAILSAAGVPFDVVAVCTALAAAITTLAMGVATNLPFALAPGLGINAVVAFDIVLGRGLPWQVGMAVVVVLVLAGLRTAIMGAVPMTLKLSIGVGIGLFITLGGLREGGGDLLRADHRPGRPGRGGGGGHPSPRSRPS